jgi:hypothetical protein
MKPREPRRKVLIKARMRLGGAWRDVCIRNISSRGLLLQAASAPSRGTYVELFRGRHLIVARVVWTSEEQFGVHTQDRLNVDAIVTEPDLSAVEFTKAVAGDPGFERRSRPRPPSPAELAERSRLLSRTLEFGCLAAFCISAGMLLFGTVERTLTDPLEIVSAQLGGRR